MSLPKKTLDWLNSHQLDYRICPQASVGDVCAQAFLLKHSRGRLYAVIPAGSFLDLAQLESVTKVDLAPLNQKEWEAIQQDTDCLTLPALPTLKQVPAVVDKKLLSQSSVSVGSGDPNLLIQLDGEDFTRLWHQPTPADISAPVILEDSQDKELDREQIDRSITNFTSFRIRQRLSETVEIPPLSDTASRILNMRSNPSSSLAELAAIVETDPSLAAQIIRWANSALYGVSGQVRSVEDAIIRVLGSDLVINLALGLCLGNALKIRHAGIDINSFWVQSILCAKAMESLVDVIPGDFRPARETSYLVGLFHKFGYLVLAHVFPPHFALVQRHLAVNPGIHHHSIEKHLLGVTREQINAWLMRDWNLPNDICAALRQVHNGTGNQYAMLCFVACHLLHEQGMCERPMSALTEDLLDNLHLSLEDARRVLDRMIASSPDFIQFAHSFS
jgi:HD-like signal output (HDOD) protein/prolyl-tRNA editing enzyme YbaK/EbsC (Cys-tRNA(Pro) deacylase)